MASTSETGHAVNVANLKIMISRLQGYGTRYNPTNNLIKFHRCKHYMSIPTLR